jgi:alpha/beta superfamily hydrolase
MPTHKIAFPGSQGATLAGRLDTPDQPPHAWAIFAHCFTCSKDSKAAAYISRALAHAGFGVLRFDFTGLGGSDGDFANTHFSSNVDDLIAAADWLRAEHGDGPYAVDIRAGDRAGMRLNRRGASGCNSVRWGRCPAGWPETLPSAPHHPVP